MLKKETIQAIAGLLKVDQAAFETALTATEETDLVIPEGLHVMTAEEMAVRDKNKKAEGQTIGKDIAIKDIRAAAGLDDTVGKDPAKIIEAISATAIKAAKIEPDKQVQALNEQLNTLRNTVQEKENEVNTWKTKAAQDAENTAILAALPKNRSSILTDAEYLNVIRSKYQIKSDDTGNRFFEKDGKMIQDNLANPRPIGDVINELFNERKWIESGAGGGAAGRGAGDAGAGGSITKKSELIAKFEKEGKPITGQEFLAELSSLSTANKEFDMNN